MKDKEPLRFGLFSICGVIQRRKLQLLLVMTMCICFLMFMWQEEALNVALEHLTALQEKLENYTRSKRTLENILEADIQPQYMGKNIFFLVTTQKHDDLVNLPARAACSVESAG